MLVTSTGSPLAPSLQQRRWSWWTRDRSGRSVHRDAAQASSDGGRVRPDGRRGVCTGAVPHGDRRLLFTKVGLIDPIALLIVVDRLHRWT